MTKIPDIFDFTIVKGDDVFVRFEFKNLDANGNKVDIDFTGYTGTFKAKRQKTDADADAVINISFDNTTIIGVDFTGFLTGVLDFIPTSVVTAAFAFNSAFYDITFVSPGVPTKTTTPIKGIITLDRGV